MASYGIVTYLRPPNSPKANAIKITFIYFSTMHVRSGYIHLEVGVLRVNGMNGTQRSSPVAAYNGPTGVGAPSIATFEFNMETVYPTHALIDRWYGLPLRCLAL